MKPVLIKMRIIDRVVLAACSRSDLRTIPPTPPVTKMSYTVNPNAIIS